jgi:hypothetical protein
VAASGGRHLLCLQLLLLLQLAQLQLNLLKLLLLGLQAGPKACRLGL